jgi:hypothetical protein
LLDRLKAGDEVMLDDWHLSRMGVKVPASLRSGSNARKRFRVTPDDVVETVEIVARRRAAAAVDLDDDEEL